MKTRKWLASLLLITLLFSDLISPILVAEASYPSNETEFYEYVELIGYEVTTPNGKKVNWTVYKGYNKIVWGVPYGRYKTGSLCGNANEYEFLGYDTSGTRGITNECFPDDARDGQHPKDWNFVNVSGASNSWSAITDTSLRNHIKNSNWTGNGASASNPLRYSHIGSDSKVRVELAPTWRATGSVFTQNRGKNGRIFYATFTVPALAGKNAAIVEGLLTTDKDTYTIKSNEDSTSGLMSLRAEGKISGYMAYSHITELKATYKSKSEKTSGQRYSNLNDTLNFNRSNYTVGTHTINLEGTVSIKTRFGDTESKKVFKKITLIVEAPNQPTISANGVADPARKVFPTSSAVTDVPVKITTTGTLSGVNANNITKYELTAKRSQDAAPLTKTFTGAEAKKLTQTADFNFTIPKSLFTADSYTQNFTVTAKATLENGNVISATNYTSSIIVPPSAVPPPEPEPEPNNDPPTVRIDGPTTVRAGDYICLTSFARDTDGEIVDQYWDTPSALGNITGKGGCIIYTNEGDYQVETVVVDDRGDTGSDTHDITVVPPKPSANLLINGSLKENRKVEIVNTSSSPAFYPINWEKSYMKITALDKNNGAAIKIKGTLNAENISKTVETLYKKKGEYKVELYVVNSAGLSDTTERIINIQPDLNPVANFEAITTTYREPNNNNIATLSLTDSSYSDDNDKIAKRTWVYKFDSNNDGSFDDEKQILIDEGNLSVVEIPVNHVGKYLVELSVVEEFGQPTIEEFVSAEDRKRDNTSDKPIVEKIIEVKNIAPNVSFEVQKKKSVEVNIDMGDAGNNPYKVADIESALNAKLKPTLAETNTELIFNVKERQQLNYPEEMYFLGTIENRNDDYGYSTIYSYLYQYDFAENKMRKLDDSPVSSNVLAVDYNGVIYYTDRSSYGNIKYYNPKTKEEGNFQLPEYPSATAITIGYDNKVYIAGWISGNYGGTSYVYEYDPKKKSIRQSSTYSSSVITKLITVDKDTLVMMENNYSNYYYKFDTISMTKKPEQIGVMMYQSSIFDSLGNGNFVSSGVFIGGNFSAQMGNIYNANGNTPSLGGMISTKQQPIMSLSDLIYLGKNNILFSANPVPSAGLPINYDGVYSLNLETKQDEFLFSENANFIKAYENDVYLYHNYALKKYNLNTRKFTSFPYTIDQEDGIKESRWNENTWEYYDYRRIPRFFYYHDYPLYPVPREGNETLDESIQKYSWTKENSKKFFVSMSKEEITGLPQNADVIVDTLKSNDAHFISVGTTKTKTNSELVISKNNNKGTFIQETNLDLIVEKMTDYILDKVFNETPTNELYLTLEDEAQYSTYFNDVENDPKYTLNNSTGDKWRYIHDQYAFENPMGIADIHDIDLDKPQIKFNRTGVYEVSYSARDNPVSNKDEFDNYRMWSKAADNFKIYVHRKPVANFTFTINSTTGAYTIINKAYDLDKLSINNGYGDGLSHMSYQWRLKGTTDWNEGLPPNPLTRAVYEVKQEVTDFQGASDTTIRELDSTGVNKAPIADFIPIPEVVKLGETIEFDNLSYDPNGDNLTAEWWIRENVDGSDFTPMSTDYEPSRVMTELGEFEVKLKVTDPTGLYDEVTKLVTVIPNNAAPIAGFKYKTPLYIGDTVFIESTATDPDGDKLHYTYTVTKPNGTRLTYQTGDREVDLNGDLTFVANNINTDLGKWIIVQIVSDGQLTDSVAASFDVLNQTIKGKVSHTQKWDENRKKYNLKSSGDENTPRGPTVFFPGEKFILNGNATETAVKVEVTILEYPQYKTELTKVAGQWEGSLWNADMLELFQDEELSFRFYATYRNGWKSDDVVKIQIIDEPYWREHTSF